MIPHYDPRPAGEPEISPGGSEAWETASSVSSVGLPESLDELDDVPSTRSAGLPATVTPLPRIGSEPRRRPPQIPLDREALVQAYWTERAKFFDHLERRFNKFQKKYTEEHAKYKRNRHTTRRIQTLARAGSSREVTKAPGVWPAAQRVIEEGTDKMVIPHATNAVRTVTRGARTASVLPVVVSSPSQPGVASTSRSFSTTRPTSSKKKERRRPIVNPDAMDVNEATRVLRALDIDQPSSAYTLNLFTRDKPKISQSVKAHSTLQHLRGRVTLPFDPRKNPDVVLVFAEKGSESFKLAEALGVNHLGGSELFGPLQEGEIKPTKVLSTREMLPQVTQALARFLGPKALMPTTRRGTVGDGEELVERINEAKGSIDWRANEKGIVQVPVGRGHWTPSPVESNVRAFAKSVRDAAQAAKPEEDEFVFNRRKKKEPPIIKLAKLRTSNGPYIELLDI